MIAALKGLRELSYAVLACLGRSFMYFLHGCLAFTIADKLQVSTVIMNVDVGYTTFYE